MADFRLRKDAETWFSEIEKSRHLKSKFDIYYFCLMIGLASGRTNDPKASGSTSKEIIGYFIDDYKAASRLLLGLLVTTEMKYRGIGPSEKAAVRELFKELVDAENGNHNLTDAGMKRMNAYASGGFDYLSEKRDAKPYHFEDFIRDYTSLIDEALA